MGNQMASADLHRILADAAPFMPNDTALEVINGVWLEARDGQIIAVSSDRFVMSVGRADYCGENFSVLIVADAVKGFIKDTKTWCTSGEPVVLELSDGQGTGLPTLGVHFANGASVPLGINAESKFTNWRSLFAQAIDAATSPEVVDGTANVDLAFLGKLSKLPTAKKAALRFRVLSKNRIFARIGDDLQVLMMQKKTELPLSSEWLLDMVIDKS